MNLIFNWDLLTVGLSVAATLVLGFTVFFNNRESLTNRTFLYFSISSSAWGIVNYWAYKIPSADFSLWLFRLVMFFAVWQIFFLFKLFYVIPNTQKKLSFYYKYIILPATILTSGLTLTPYIFSGVSEITKGEVPKTIVENGIIIFAVISLSLFISAVYQIILKILHAKKGERLTYTLMLVGAIATFSLIIIFNFILPAFFYTVTFIPLGAIFTLPLIVLTSYAVYNGKFINVKIVSASTIVFFLSIITFIEVLFTENFWLLFLRIMIFSLVLLFGLFLIRSVMKEVKQREEIEKLAGALTLTNNQLKFANNKLKELDRQKTEFVSIASHQLRSPLTAIKGYSSMLLEGSFGPVEDKARGAIDRIFESSQKLVNVIEDFLNITRIELGRMKYEMSVFDLSKLVETVMTDQKPTAEKKGLDISLESGSDDYQISADSGKVTQVLSNLIDNSIKYTPARTEGQSGPAGWIKIKLENAPASNKLTSGKSSKKEVVRLTIADSGVGLEPATLKKLFNKFTRANDAGKINITGTGLGLYVAKQIVESLGGKIWAESEGKGKGSQFIVEFPHATGQATTVKTKVEAYTKAGVKQKKTKI